MSGGGAVNASRREPPPLRAPTWAETFARESLASRELLRLPLAAGRLVRSPRGTGLPVLLVPGLGASDASLTPLRLHLQRLGHDARPADLGRIGRDVASTATRLLARVRGIADSTGAPVALVGQSIGGVLSREVARQDPGVVRRVITFGTPVLGGPEYTATRYGYSPYELERIRAIVAERARQPIGVPLTAMWSRNDGVVAPAACIDPSTGDVEHVEVTSSHLGMGLDPDVWHVVAERLARDNRSGRSSQR
jgi:pimeloyl-ACP methyl ester carboxylesterase